MEADTDSGCEDDGLGHHRQRGGENGLLADTDKGEQIRVVLSWKYFGVQSEWRFYFNICWCQD